MPFKVTLIGNPAYDLMDVFSFSGEIADANKLFCMTKYNFKYNGGYEMEGVGENPALASAKSKTDKNISGLLAQVGQGKLGITTFTNASAYDLGETAVKVISVRFATSEANHMLLFAQIVVDVKADAVRRSAVAADGEFKLRLFGFCLFFGGQRPDSDSGFIVFQHDGVSDGKFEGFQPAGS